MADYLTTAEAADILRVTPETIRRMTRDGRLVAVKLGRMTRIPRAALPTAHRPERPEPPTPRGDWPPPPAAIAPAPPRGDRRRQPIIIQ